MRREHSGDWALGAVILGIAGWDVYGPETISNSVRRHSEKPWEKFMLAGFMGALTLHLLDIYEHHGVPDPFKLALERTKHATLET